MFKNILSSCCGLLLWASFSQAALGDQAMAPGTAYRDCADCPEMVVMPTPAGFIMGSLLTDPNHLESERPRHSIRIAYGLAIGRFEVTRQEFALFAAEVGIAPPAGCKTWDKKAGDWVTDESLSWQDPGFAQSDRDPVVCVPWDLAVAYADWLSGKTGKSYRLLSESEWEWVARAGSDAINPWGNATESACRYANMADFSAADEWGASKDAKEGIFHCDDGAPYTAPVGSYQPNAFGLFDMQGNAREWTLDCWHESYKGAPRDGSARFDGYCERRSVRGGSWLSLIPTGRNARRIGPTIAIGDTSTGFRLAVSY